MELADMRHHWLVYKLCRNIEKDDDKFEQSLVVFAVPPTRKPSYTR